eukprot:g79755.t1
MGQKQLQVQGMVQGIARPVKCIETGEVFESITAAARSINKKYRVMQIAIRAGLDLGEKGHHWAYCDLEGNIIKAH